MFVKSTRFKHACQLLLSLIVGTYIYFRLLYTDNLHEVHQKSFLIIVINLH